MGNRQAQARSAGPKELMVVVSPTTQNVVDQREVDEEAVILEKLAACRQAHLDWKRRTLEERISVLRAVVERLQREATDDSGISGRLAKRLAVETGRPLSLSRGLFEMLPGRMTTILDLCADLERPDEGCSTPGLSAEVRYEPCGVVAAVLPWNFPELMFFDFVFPALALGNGVVIKPSEACPNFADDLQRFLEECGIPEDLLVVVYGRAKEARAVVDGVDGVVAIGSTSMGKALAEHAAARLIPCAVEAGGNDAFVVLPDADVPAAAASLAEGAFVHAGQNCNGVERVYCTVGQASTLAEELAKLAEAEVVGDPQDEKTTIGPMCLRQQVAHLHALVQDAVMKGAQVMTTPKAVPEHLLSGNFFPPVVLANCNSSMRIMQEEIFGPVVAIQGFPQDSGVEAIARLVNTSKYGLTAGIYTKSAEKARELGRRLNVGTVYHNCNGVVDVQVPWTGRRESGVGGIFSRHFFRENFQRPKAFFFA